MRDALAIWDPRVLQGLFTLTAAVVGAAAALLIALWVYPRQKAYDRSIELRRETRASYRQYLRSCSTIFEQIRGYNDPIDSVSDLRDRMRQTETELRHATVLLYLTSNDHIVHLAETLLDEFSTAVGATITTLSEVAAPRSGTEDKGLHKRAREIMDAEFGAFRPRLDQLFTDVIVGMADSEFFDAEIPTSQRRQIQAKAKP